MSELGTLGLAGNDAIVDHDAELGPDVDLGPASRAEAIVAGALCLTIKLWCLPFLAVGWALAWGAILVLRCAGGRASYEG